MNRRRFLVGLIVVGIAAGVLAMRRSGRATRGLISGEYGPEISRSPTAGWVLPFRDELQAEARRIVDEHFEPLERRQVEQLARADELARRRKRS